MSAMTVSSRLSDDDADQAPSRTCSSLVEAKDVVDEHNEEQAEDGRILLLTLGFIVLGLMLIAVVASATAVHLSQRRLAHLAEELALDAADSGNYLIGNLALTNADVTDSVTAHLATHPRPQDLPPDVVVVHAETPDGSTATVHLRATCHPPLLAWFTTRFDAGITVTASASARAIVHN